MYSGKRSSAFHLHYSVRMNLIQTEIRIPSQNHDSTLVCPVSHWEVVILGWKRHQLRDFPRPTDFPEGVSRLKILLISSSKTELALDVTESRAARNYEVEADCLTWLLTNIKDRDLFGALLKLEQVSHLSFLQLSRWHSRSPSPIMPSISSSRLLGAARNVSLSSCLELLYFVHTEEGRKRCESVYTLFWVSFL